MSETKYLSATEYAELHGVSSSRVRRLLREDRIEGAVRIGNQWCIPEDAPFPADKRYKTGKYVGWRK